MTDAMPHEAEPKILRAGEHLIAHRMARYYALLLPVYSPEATAIIKGVPGAHWERSDGAWHVRASNHQTLQRAMDRIAAIPGMDRAARPGRATATGVGAAQAGRSTQRTLVLADIPCEVGQILSYRRKPVAVEHVGRAFMADSRYAKWGKADLCGRMVRFASHHPASADEIAAWERVLEERARVVEPDRDHVEAVDEPNP
ncbi:hypothetical protein [Paracoccus sp. ME4]|uniref:hypothetical protein n=1 Tax=Paracoccus sp. ME4 TaxID=3138066 RepID=UPI00398B37F9